MIQEFLTKEAIGVVTKLNFINHTRMSLILFYKGFENHF